MNDFVLTPPFAVDSDLAVSIIQAGTMPAAESLVIRLEDWSALDLLAHWYAEVESMVERRRNRCCIVGGLAIVSGKLVPTEWWKMFAFDSEVRVQYQVLNTYEIDDLGAWEHSENWWKNVPEYHKFFDDGEGMREVSEWIVSIDSLARWHRQCSALMERIHSVQDEQREG